MILEEILGKTATMTATKGTTSMKNISVTVPMIKVWSSVLAKISLWTRLSSPNEVSGIGLVKKVGSVFEVYAVFLLKQKVTSADSDLDEQEVMKLMADLNKKGIPTEDLRFWWHSHGTTGTFWSGQDNSTINSMSYLPWFISLVVNSLGSYKLRIDAWDPFKINCDNLDYVIHPDIPIEDTERYTEEYKLKVKEDFFADDYLQYYGYGGTWKQRAAAAKQFKPKTAAGFAKPPTTSHPTKPVDQVWPPNEDSDMIDEFTIDEDSDMSDVLPVLIDTTNLPVPLDGIHNKTEFSLFDRLPEKLQEYLSETVLAYSDDPERAVYALLNGYIVATIRILQEAEVIKFETATTMLRFMENELQRLEGKDICNETKENTGVNMTSLTTTNSKSSESPSSESEV